MDCLPANPCRKGHLSGDSKPDSIKTSHQQTGKRSLKPLAPMRDGFVLSDKGITM